MRDRIPMITALVCALLAMVATRLLDDGRDPRQPYDAVAAAESSGEAVQFGVLGGAVGFALGLALRGSLGPPLAKSAEVPDRAAGGERAQAGTKSGLEPWVWALVGSFVVGLGLLLWAL